MNANITCYHFEDGVSTRPHDILSVIFR